MERKLKVMSKILKNKKRELERRSNQHNYLKLRADQAYEKKNKELYEAFEVCIKHQQKKMLKLIYEIGTIEQLFLKWKQLFKKENYI